MHQDAFVKLEYEEMVPILDQLNPEFDGTVFDPARTTIMPQHLDFYEGYRLLDIADYSSMPAAQRKVVYGPEKFFILNWSNDLVYRMNKEIPLKLTKKNVADYVRFFFRYVRGRRGRFTVIENTDDINWRDDPPYTVRKAIGKMIMPVAYKGRDRNKVFHLEMCVMFKDSLFKTDVRVEPDSGLISLENEKALIEDMPVLDNALSQ